MFLLEGKGCWEKKKSDLAQTFPPASERTPLGESNTCF